MNIRHADQNRQRLEYMRFERDTMQRRLDMARPDDQFRASAPGILKQMDQQIAELEASTAQLEAHVMDFTPANAETRGTLRLPRK